MMLEETGKSIWSWKQNSMITINSQTGEITYNSEFYLMKHFGHYIKPGAVKLDVKNEGQFLAFKNLDNSIVIQYYNSLTEEDLICPKNFGSEMKLFIVPTPVLLIALRNWELVSSHLSRGGKPPFGISPSVRCLRG